MTNFVVLQHQIFQTMEYCISTIMDQNGLPFVEAPDGGIDFGHITVEQNLPPAPIRLSKRYGRNKENIWSASELQNEEPAYSNTSQPATNADKEAGSNGTVSDVSQGKNTTFS